MKNILVVFLFLACASAHAALIDNSTYISDSDSGLDWLKLAPTLDRSYNDVSSKFGAGQEFDGWRYASGSEFEQLLLNAGLLPDSAYSAGFYAYTPCDPGVNFCENWNRGLDTVGLAGMVSMSDLFGNLASLVPANLGCVASTSGLISDVDTGNNDPTANFTARIFWCGAIQGGIDTFSLSQVSSVTDAGTGSYLVRTSAVPVPAAVWMFGSALGVLGWMRRKKA